MACNRNCRPHNDSKEPEKDADQGDWMRNNFDQLTPSREKNRNSSQGDCKRKFAPNRVSQMRCAFRLPISLPVHRHAREDIEAIDVMQLL